MPTSDHKQPKLAPSEILLKLFTELENSLDQRDLRYVLSLLMIRRRILRLEDTIPDEHGGELMMLYCARDESTHHVPIVMPDAARAEQIQEQLAKLLFVEGAMRSNRRSSVDAVFRERRFAALASLLAPAVLAGGGCANMNQLFPQASTARVLPTAPTLADVIAVINNNTNLVRSLYSADASLSAPLTPTLRATLAVERPRRLRLRAETALTGPELDVGSNDQLFWLWMKRQTPPSIFYCRHEQYAQSAARQMFPVQPEWLIDALGLPSVDPAGQHLGPTPVDRGKLRLQSQLTSPFGPQTRTIVIDAPAAGFWNNSCTTLPVNSWPPVARAITCVIRRAERRCRGTSRFIGPPRSFRRTSTSVRYRSTRCSALKPRSSICRRWAARPRSTWPRQV